MKTILYLLFSIFPFFQSYDKYFDLANNNIKKYNPPRKDLVIVIDYTKNILMTRLYLIDMKTNKVILESRVSHAWNSGYLYPNDLSNDINTKKTSGGNYITLNKYLRGKYGNGLRVKGLDKGINDNALKRAIVFHSDKTLKAKWSWGCFATPEEINKEIISKCEGGVLVCVITE